MEKRTLKGLMFCAGIAVVASLIILVGLDKGADHDPFDAESGTIHGHAGDERALDDEFSRDHSEVYGTRSEILRYISVNGCSECHPELVEGWRGTGHGKDFTPGGVYPPVNYGSPDENFSGSCANCHVVGMGDNFNGGFDPNEWWSNATPVNYQLVGNVDLIGIQCEACHGPASYHVDFQTKDYCSGCKPDEEDEVPPEGVEPAEWYKNPSVEESCMGNEESGCHSTGSHDTYTPWKASTHSNQDQLDAEGAGEELHGVNSFCARCKSPSQYDPFAPLRLAEEFSAEEWHGVGCADCHDPHSNEFEYQLRNEVDDACTICHTNEATAPVPGDEPHHTQKEAFGGTMGIGVTGQKGMAGVTCVDCHMWRTPSVGHGVSMSDSLGIERHEAHSFEPSSQACADCHSDLISKMPEHGRPANNTGENEELWNEWDEWGMEWNETVEKWEKVIEDWQSDFERLKLHVEANWNAADATLRSSEENGTVSEETLAEARSLLDDARWNIGLSNDGSGGAHNPDFFTDLLNAANVNSNTALELLTTNGPPIANAGMSKLTDIDTSVTFDGSASSDRDGAISSYLWNFGDSSANGTTAVATHTYSAEGTYLVTLTVTDNTGAVDTDMITVFVVTSPLPVDLTDIETDILDIKQDSTEIKLLLEAFTANASSGDGSDEQQVTTNMNDIDDLDDQISRMTGALGVAVFVILILILFVCQLATATILNEISENRDTIMEALDHPLEENEPSDDEESEKAEGTEEGEQ